MSVRISSLLIVACCLFGLAMASLEAEDRAITWSPKLQAILDALNKGRTTPKPAPILPFLPITAPPRVKATPPPPPPYAQFVPDPTKNPYCNITTCGRRQGNHTVCLNPTLAWGVNATNPNLALSQVSTSDQTNILSIINGYRSQVALGQVTGQPAASNMRKVNWDPELAFIAQTWTQNGTLANDACRDTRRWISGQTFYNKTTSTALAPNWQDIVFSWYSQVTKVVAADVALLPVDWKHFFEIGDYTQLVWGNSSLVGCGASVFQQPGSSSYTLAAACNWGAAGNWDGQGLYKQGPAGTACDPGWVADAGTGLCQ